MKYWLRLNVIYDVAVGLHKELQVQPRKSTSTVVSEPGLQSHRRNDRPNISPEFYAKLLNCQASSSSVERSFSTLQKLLSNDRNFSPDNVWKYLAIYVNKPLE